MWLQCRQVLHLFVAMAQRFMNEKQIEKLLKDADKDQNDVIDFEEFVTATPKALRINLVKLAKKNGHDLGFLV